ncbi:MAG: sugar phosphate isomerase/epimerase [Christensenellaceae bacterium]|jgi:sugar phosphate isomerase/epimerase|nr:sugar phosphate isomerase/epimerase [Christensenellaceae bacterium]
MSKVQIGSPLYIVREQCQRDLFAAIQKLKEVGFDGIEFQGFFGKGAKETRQCLDDLGLQALGSQLSVARLREDARGTFDFHRTVGISLMTVAGYSADELLNQTGKVVDEIAGLSAIAKEYGIRLLYHNHDWEVIEKKDGKTAMETLLDAADPSILQVEPDIGWMESTQADAAYYLSKYKGRCPIIHIKDYYTSNHDLLGRVHDFLPARGPKERGEFEFRPAGYGVCNLPRLLPYCIESSPEWYVTDHDMAYERDPFFDLKLGLDYMRALFALQPQKG